MRKQFLGSVLVAALLGAGACGGDGRDALVADKKSGGSGGKASSGGSGGNSSGGSGGTGTAGTGGNSKSGGAPGNATEAELRAGLIGHWQFEEGSGIAVKDSSGQGNDGVVVEGGTSNSPDHAGPTWGEGKMGKGLQFDGIDDWVRIPDADSIDSTGLNNSVTETAWVKVDKINTVKDFNFVISRLELGTRLDHYGLGMFQGLPVAVIHFFKAIGPTNVPIGEWTHMGFTYDGITMRVYINGAEVSFLDAGWPIAADETPVTIGAAINEEDVIEHLSATVDEVRLYNRELSANEVATLAGQ
jgi:hypothetical protein